MYLGRSDLKLGVLTEELLKEAVSQGYSYVVGDYSLILEAEDRKVIIQSSGVLVEEKYYWRQLDYPYSYMTQELSKETLKTLHGNYHVGKRLIKPTNWEQSFAERVIDCFVSPSWVVLSSLDTE